MFSSMRKDERSSAKGRARGNRKIEGPKIAGILFHLVCALFTFRIILKHITGVIRPPISAPSQRSHFHAPQTLIFQRVKQSRGGKVEGTHFSLLEPSVQCGGDGYSLESWRPAAGTKTI